MVSPSSSSLYEPPDRKPQFHPSLHRLYRHRTAINDLVLSLMDVLHLPMHTRQHRKREVRGRQGVDHLLLLLPCHPPVHLRLSPTLRVISQMISRKKKKRKDREEGWDRVLMGCPMRKNKGKIFSMTILWSKWDLFQFRQRKRENLFLTVHK
jgi:hypothetical protein